MTTQKIKIMSNTDPTNLW